MRGDRVCVRCGDMSDMDEFEAEVDDYYCWACGGEHFEYWCDDCRDWH